MRHVNFALLEQTSSDKIAQLAKLINLVFSDQYLYVNAEFRKKIQQDRKGYVSLKDLAKISIVSQFFSNGWNIESKQIIVILKVTIAQFCLNLYQSSGRVRRLVPFDFEKWKQIKPIAIERLQQTCLTISDVRQYLGIETFSNTEHFYENQEEEYVKIYSLDYRNAMQKQSTPPFKLLDYEGLSIQYERETRHWLNQERKLYAQNTFVRPRYIQQQIYREDYEMEGMGVPEFQMRQHKQINYQQQRLKFELMVKQPNMVYNQLLRSTVNKMEIQ